MRLGLSWLSRAAEIALIVPGEMSWPWRTRSENSRITVSPVATSSSEPSSVTTLPRRNTSQSRWSSSVFMTWSPAPASSAATSFGSSSCVRTLGGELLSHDCADPLSVGAALDFGHHERHHPAHLLGRGRAGFRDRVPHDGAQLFVGELLRHVGRDDLGLELLVLGELGAASVAVCLGGLQAALSLPLEDLDLVGVAVLGRLLQLRGDQAQRVHAPAIARLHRLRHVMLDLLEYGHGSSVGAPRQLVDSEGSRHHRL